MRKLVFVLTYLTVVRVYAQRDNTLRRVVSYLSGYTVRTDEMYTTVDGWNGREDIYYNPLAKKPTPIVFIIHGGAWSGGNKEALTDFTDYFSMGFAVANVEYRLSGKAKAPAAIEDIRAAILYVVKHAKDLNVDTKKIFLVGYSAGGHLALMGGGLLQNDSKFDTGFKNIHGYIIAGIVDYYGPTDLTVSGIDRNPSATAWLGPYLGNRELMASVSPIYYVKKTSPPVLIAHGDQDKTVPYEQSLSLFNKLQSLGVKSKLITVEGGEHGGGGFSVEKRKEIRTELREFFYNELH